jgi:hypothetical protein
MCHDMTASCAQHMTGQRAHGALIAGMHIVSPADSLECPFTRPQALGLEGAGGLGGCAQNLGPFSAPLVGMYASA